MLRIKLLIAHVITSPIAGWLIGFFFPSTISSLKWPQLKIRNSKVLKFRTKAQFYWGLYESAELRFVQKYVPTNSTILELGSSIGVMASFLTKFKNPRRMILVEAYPALIPLLEANLNLNGATNFKIRNAAVTSSKTDLYFTPGEDTISGQLTTNPTTGSIAVEGVRLLDLVESEGLHGYILISDVEGAELSFLLQENSLNNCELLVIELHQSSSNGREYSTSELTQIIISSHGLELVDKYGDVLVFRKPTI